MRGLLSRSRGARLCLLSILVLSLRITHSAGAQEYWSLLRSRGEDAVEIRAETMRAAPDRTAVEAAGNVVVTWRDVRLMADRVTYDPREHVATATGNVVLEDGSGNTLRCQRLSVNTQTEQGEIEDGSLWIAEEGYRVWGKRLVKTGPATYRVEEGGFTTCDGTWPSWQVEAGEVEVELEGYLVARDAAFWVENVPLLYTPYLVFPVKIERQSGFLLPKVGYTSTEGAIAALRYYWAISESADATVQLQYRSRRGWSEEAQLRYVLAEGHWGRLELSHLDDRIEQSQRYTYRASHRSRFDNASRIGVEVDYVTDKQYERDLGETLEARGIERKRSYAVGTHDVAVGSLYGLVDFYQTLQDSQAEVLQTLPSVGLLGRETPLTDRLAWSPTVRATRFWRGRDQSGERLELIPRLAASTTAGGVGLAARGGYRQNLYWTEEEDVAAHGAADAEVLADLALWRSYGRYLHEVEPRLSLRWEERGRGAEPPSYDQHDDFAHRTVVGLLLDNRWFDDEYLTTVLALDLEGRYDLGEGRWLPLRGEFSWHPGPDVLLAGDAELDSAENALVRWAARGELQDGRGDRLLFGYRYLQQEASYLDGGLEVPVRQVLTLQYRNRYSVKDERLLEELIGALLAHPCWTLHLTYSRNWRQDDHEFEYRYYAQLELKGLGRLGTWKGVLP